MTAQRTEPKPRLNHVALTVPRDLLDEDGRRAIAEFYGDLFGWTEIEQMTQDREVLVLMLGHWTEFVFLLGSDDPASFTSTEHFGVQTETLEQFEAIRDRIKERQADDDRIELEDEEPTDFGPVVLHSYYVRHLLPVKVEVQHYAGVDG